MRCFIKINIIFSAFFSAKIFLIFHAERTKKEKLFSIFIVLGCRRVFHNEKEPAFKAIYNIFDKVYYI